MSNKVTLTPEDIKLSYKINENMERNFTGKFRLIDEKNEPKWRLRGIQGEIAVTKWLGAPLPDPRVRGFAADGGIDIKLPNTTLQVKTTSLGLRWLISATEDNPQPWDDLDYTKSLCTARGYVLVYKESKYVFEVHGYLSRKGLMEALYIGELPHVVKQEDGSIKIEYRPAVLAEPERFRPPEELLSFFTRRAYVSV